MPLFGSFLSTAHMVPFFDRHDTAQRFCVGQHSLSLGTQEYRPDVWRVWNDGVWQEYDLKGETEAVRAERVWSEAVLQAQRRNNAK